MSSIQKNFFYNVVLSLSQLIVPLFTFPYVARILGPGELGKVNYADSFAGYFILIAALGIPIYGVREIARASKLDVEKTFSELFSLHLILIVAALLVYFVTISMIPSLSKYNVFLYYGGLMVFSTAFICEWYFQGLGKFKFIAIRTVLNRFFFFAILFFVVKTKNDSIFYFILIVLSTLVNAVVNFVIISREVTIRFHFSKQVFFKHFKALFYIFFSRASVTIFLFFDTLMLGILSVEKEVGFFTAALKITKIPIIIISSLGVVLIPDLASAFAKNNIIYFRSLVNKSVDFVLATSIPIVFFFISTSDTIILTFTGYGYAESSTLIKIMCPIIFFIGLSTIFSQQILLPMKKDKEIMICVLIAVVLCFTFNFLLIPQLKAKGAAITNLIVEGSLAVSSFLFARKYLDNFFNFKILFKYIAVFLPMVLFLEIPAFLSVNIFVILILSVIISLLYYISVFTLLIKNQMIDNLILKLKKKFL